MLLVIIRSIPYLLLRLRLRLQLRSSLSRNAMYDSPQEHPRHA
jgi:hypothetical protein